MRKLKEYYCIYLDILGYKNRIKKFHEEKLEHELNDFLDHVAFNNNYLLELKDIIEFDMKLFSDNLLISFEVTTETINKIHLILDHVIDYQKSLIQKNYFIRGGISKGLLYVDEKIVWGPALIKAVKIEESIVYPVIGVSDDVLRTNDLINNQSKIINIPIVKINNTKYFLDYLFSTINPDKQYRLRDTFLQEHQRQIEYNLSINHDERIISKYLMLAKYHNAFCDDYKGKIQELQNYLITYLPKDKVLYDRKYI